MSQLPPPPHLTPVTNSKGPAADRLLAVAFILLQLGVLAFLSGARVFPIVMAILTLCSLRTSRRMHLERLPRNLIYALLTIGFLLHYVLAPYPLPMDTQFIRSALAHSLARLLMTVQILQLYLAHRGGRLPIWLAACGVMSLTFAANVRTPAAMHWPLLWGVAVFIGLYALYCSRARREIPHRSRADVLRGTMMVTALAAGLLLGSGTAWSLQKHERDIESFLSDYLGTGRRTARAGFNPTGRLESVTAWRSNRADTIVLRIFAEDAPGYLRGTAFDKYQGSSRETSYTPWAVTSARRPLPRAPHTRDIPDLRPGDFLYDVSTLSTTAPSRVLDIWPDQGADSTFFTPLGTRTLATSDSAVRIDANNILSHSDLWRTLPYLVTANPRQQQQLDATQQPADEIRREQLTALEVSIDAEVRQLAADLFSQCTTSREKMAAVQEYFVANYEYRLGITVPHRMDPVTFFLTQKPDAHCEYFATGTAVLLRLAGIPCRYVVGFVAAEWNGVGGFWVARQRDAHAWVEAYDDATGQWVIVESTPPAGVPQPRTPGYPAQAVDSFRHRISMWQILLREYGLGTLWPSLARGLWSIPSLVMLMGLVAGLLLRYRPAFSLPRRRPHVRTDLKPMHKVLARLDRRVRGQGFERDEYETLTHFADRIRASDHAPAWKFAAADCYALYARLRYRGQTGPDAVRRLHEATARIPKSASLQQSR